MTTRAAHLITDTDRRGAQVFAMDLARALTGDHHDVRALAPGRSSNPLQVPVLGRGRLHPATFLGVRRTLIRAPVTVAHGSSTLFACAASGVGRSRPFVYRQISDQRFWAGTRLRRSRVRVYLRSAARVVALWDGAAETLSEEFGVPRERISVIPNGVPPAQFSPVTPAERAAARRRFGLPDDVPLLLSLGALSHEKGVDTAIRTVAELPDHHLLVIGAGPERGSLQRLAEAVAPGAVTFHPPVTDAAAAYAACDVVLLTSRSEGMPAVLIEAGLRGIPAVASAVGAVIDVVQDNGTGRLVKTDDPPSIAAAVLDALAHRQVLGAAARQHCLDRYSIDVVAAQWRAVLDEVAGGAH